MTLVTGFLGSGKTTLINAALRSPELVEDGGCGQRVRRGGSRSPAVRAAVPTRWWCSRTAAFAAPFEATWSARSTALTTPRQRGRHPRVRQRRDRDVGPRRAGPGPSGVPVGADAGRALPRCERSDARRCCQLVGNVGSARRVAFGRSRLADQIRITKLDWSPATGKTPWCGFGSISVESTRQPISPRSTGRRRQSPNSFRLEVSTRPTRSRILGHGSTVQAYQNDAHDHDGCGDNHSHHEHDHDGGHSHSSHLEGRGIENFVLTRESPLAREEVQFLLGRNCAEPRNGASARQGTRKRRRGTRPTSCDPGRATSPPHDDLARPLAR